MKQSYDVVILGAGAGGLMCAAELNRRCGLRVAVVEGNRRAGVKLKAAGGGKCNMTNVDVAAKHFDGEASLVGAVIARYGRDWLLGYLRRRGLEPVLRKERYYFCRRSSEELISLLMNECSQADFFYSQHVQRVEKKEEGFAVVTTGGLLTAPRVVVATGAKSYAPLGASDIGLTVAEAFGHRVHPFVPALAGLTLQKEQFWMKELSGISFAVRIRTGQRSIDEEMLFTHRGISGPAVLSASLYWRRGEIEIDFLPEHNVEALCRGSNRLVSSRLPLPKRFVKAFLSHAGIEDRPCNRLSPEALARLGTLHAYRFSPAGTDGFAKAEACRGGVDGNEIDLESMQSLLTPGLYFVGEVLDVTGELGGYNVQWAFGSAAVCAEAIAASAG